MLCPTDTSTLSVYHQYRRSAQWFVSTALDVSQQTGVYHGGITSLLSNGGSPQLSCYRWRPLSDCLPPMHKGAENWSLKEREEGECSPISSR